MFQREKFICLLLCVTGCGADKTSGNIAEIEFEKETTESLLSDPIFGEYGRPIFPVDNFSKENRYTNIRGLVTVSG